MKSWVKAYLNRIDYQGSIEPDAETLASIHQAHMYRVPFEDLDIHNRIALSLRLSDLKEKILVKNRGGFCYELNFMFGSLLKELGYQVIFISGRVYNEDTGQLGPEFDHMALMVGSNRDWLVDVGFGGRAFIRPLALEFDTIQHDPAGYYRIATYDVNQYQLQRSLDNKNFLPLYNFTLTPHNIRDFYDQCYSKQHDSDSHFVRNKICTLATVNGRKSILNDTFTVRVKARKQIVTIETPEQEQSILAEHFGIRSSI